MLSRANIIAVIMVLAFLIAPMFLIQSLTESPEEATGAATVTVALGTIIRSNGRNIIKSTFMSAVRTGLRAVTRRLIRTMLPLLLRMFLPAVQTSTKRNLEASDLESNQPLAVAMTLGMLTLSASFYGVVSLHPNLDANTFVRGLSLFTLAILAGLNVVIHYAVMAWSGIRSDVETSLKTSFDGILLQAYFTGALSFLPLASDVELKGTASDKADCSTRALLVMLLIAICFDSLGILLGWPILEVWSAQLLLYTFVISFPLKPLEGSDIFAVYKLRWLGVFSAILLTFLLNMPETFYAIL